MWSIRLFKAKLLRCFINQPTVMSWRASVGSTHSDLPGFVHFQAYRGSNKQEAATNQQNMLLLESYYVFEVQLHVGWVRAMNHVSPWQWWTATRWWHWRCSAAICQNAQTFQDCRNDATMTQLFRQAITCSRRLTHPISMLERDVNNKAVKKVVELHHH